MNITTREQMLQFMQAPERVIVGQQLGDKCNDVYPYGYTEYVKKLATATGKTVALVGMKLAEPEDTIKTTVTKLAAEGVTFISASHCGNNPWTGGTYKDVSYTDMPNLNTNAAWQAELDKLSRIFKWSEQFGIVWLLREFHEFTYAHDRWWHREFCGGSDYALAAAVMSSAMAYAYGRIMDAGVINILRAYNPAETGYYMDVAAAFPGAEHVDIVGTDLYADSVTLRGNDYAQLTSLGKPFAFFEIGPSGLDGAFDNADYIDAIKVRYPLTKLMHAWSSWDSRQKKAAIIDNQNASGLLNDVWVVTRDELVLLDEEQSLSPSQSQSQSPSLSSSQSQSISPSASESPSPTPESDGEGNMPFLDDLQAVETNLRSKATLLQQQAQDLVVQADTVATIAAALQALDNQLDSAADLIEVD